MLIKDVLLLTERIVSIYLDTNNKKRIETDKNSLYRFMSISELAQLLGFNPLPSILNYDTYKTKKVFGKEKITDEFEKGSTMKLSGLESSHLQVMGDSRNYYRRQLAISDFAKYCIKNGGRNESDNELIAFLNELKEAINKGTSINVNNTSKNRNTTLSSDEDILQNKIGEFDEDDTGTKRSINNKFYNITSNFSKSNNVFNALYTSKKKKSTVSDEEKEFIDRFTNFIDNIRHNIGNQNIQELRDIIKNITTNPTEENKIKLDQFLEKAESIRKNDSFTYDEKELLKRRDSLSPHYEDVNTRYKNIKSFFRTLTKDVAKFWDNYDCLVEFDGEKLANLVQYTNQQIAKDKKELGKYYTGRSKINGKLSPFNWDPRLLGSTVNKKGVSDNFDKYIDPNYENIYSEVDKKAYSKDSIRLLTMQIGYAIANGEFNESVHRYLNNISKDKTQESVKDFILNEENFIKQQFEKYKDKGKDKKAYKTQENKANPFLTIKNGANIGKRNNEAAYKVYNKVLQDFLSNKQTLNVIFDKFDEAEERLSLNVPNVNLEPGTIKTIWIKDLDAIKDNYNPVLKILYEIDKEIFNFRNLSEDEIKNKIEDIKLKKKQYEELMTSSLNSLKNTTFLKQKPLQYSYKFGKFGTTATHKLGIQVIDKMGLEAFISKIKEIRDRILTLSKADKIPTFEMPKNCDMDYFFRPSFVASNVYDIYPSKKYKTQKLIES